VARLMSRGASLFACLVVACGDRPSGEAPAGSRVARHSADSGYALVQQRGHQAMGVDQYTSSHRFESLPDGGRISLERDPSDRAGVAQIRSHMRQIAASFREGNFALPGFVHDREVPGTRVMRERRSLISYLPDSTLRGGQLRIISRDPTAVAAIHEFLAFQRRDHRAPATIP
jgi:hypothetical protein